MPVFQFYLTDKETAKVMQKLVEDGKDPSITKLAKQLVLEYAGGEVGSDGDETESRGEEGDNQ